MSKDKATEAEIRLAVGHEKSKQSQPKRHHFVPKVYMAPWADASEQVALRRRKGTSVHTPNLDNVAVESGLHGRGEEAADVERVYGEIEGGWPDLRMALLSGMPLSDHQEILVAEFVAIQRSRTRQSLAKAEFVNRVRRWLGTELPTFDQMHTFLREEYLDFQPSKGEVQGAWDYYNTAASAFPDGGSPFSREERHEFAVSTVAPLLAKRFWRVERCRKPILFTSDAPVVLWRRRSDRDFFEGFGIKDAEEIWLPLDPQHLLVLGIRNVDSLICDVQPKRFIEVNTEIAAHCFEFLIASPHRQNRLGEVPLRRIKPTLRFNIRSAIGVDEFGNEYPYGEMLHTWTPEHDDPGPAVTDWTS